VSIVSQHIISIPSFYRGVYLPFLESASKLKQETQVKTAYTLQRQLPFNPFLIDNAPNPLDLATLELIKDMFAEADTFATRVAIPQISINRGDIVKLNADGQCVVKSHNDSRRELEVWNLVFVEGYKVLVFSTCKKLVVINEFLVNEWCQRQHRCGVKRHGVVVIDGFKSGSWRSHLQICGEVVVGNSLTSKQYSVAFEERKINCI
jgi:hypothetical protein